MLGTFGVAEQQLAAHEGVCIRKMIIQKSEDV
jgi:hypothetical protein